MQGLIAEWLLPSSVMRHDDLYKSLAIMSVDAADALIAELEK